MTGKISATKRLFVWVAEYGVEAPTLPAGWDSWYLWQWRGDAAVDGVERSADLSRVNRAAGDLDRLLVQRDGTGRPTMAPVGGDR